MEDYRALKITGIKEAAPRNQNVNKAFGEQQGKEERGNPYRMVRKTQEKYEAIFWHRPGDRGWPGIIKNQLCHACLARYPEKDT